MPIADHNGTRIHRDSTLTGTVRRKLLGGAKYFYVRYTGRPKLVNLEVTKLCNAGCDFCDYWQTQHEVRLTDYTPVIKRINPLIVTITGGEPMIRKDLTNIVRQVKGCSSYIYAAMITKGDLLTVDKAAELFEAGLDQISLSLDFLSEKHDESRGIPGLWAHLSGLIPRLAAIKGANIGINTIIMDDNLDQVLDFAHQARAWGVQVSFSSYSVMKTNNSEHFVSESVERVCDTVEGLIEFKRANPGVIATSDYYLRKVPGYFETGNVSDCQAGRNMLTVTPSGHIKRCSEMPVIAHGTEFEPGIFNQTSCTSCWYNCRGETEAPLTFSTALDRARSG